MARPRILEVDYFHFRDALGRATAAGNRIEPKEKKRWDEWVREHEIREAAFKAFTDDMYEGLNPVIIASEDEWDGYFLVSTVEEACLKWSRDKG